MAEWEDEDVVTEILANTKTILVQNAAPTVAYDGQVWSCTSSDPPLLKTYDGTNTQWMEHADRNYSSSTDGYKPKSRPSLNGRLALQFDSASTTYSGHTFLYFKANNVIYGVKSA